MGNLINISGEYRNKDVVDNVIRYITRTRDNETRLDDLRGYGAAGVGSYVSPQVMISRFKAVQNSYGIEYRGGRRILHEVFSITDREFTDMGRDIAIVNRLASDLCLEYYRMGFQVVYAVHWDMEKKLHIHFAVNAVSYKTGKKINTFRKENWYRENRFNSILWGYCCPGTPFFDDEDLDAWAAEN